MNRPISYRFLVLAFIGILSMALTGCAGGGGSGVGPITSAGNGSVSGSVSTSAMGNMRANALEVANPAAGKIVTLGYYDKNGLFVSIKTGETDGKGRYTFTGVPVGRKNYIVRAEVGTEIFECVIPEIIKDGIVTAPVVDPDSKALAIIILEAARSGYSDKINPAEIFSRIPPSAIAAMKNNHAHLRTIAQAFVEREKAIDQLGAGIGFDKINELRRFGFEQSRTIMAGIEEGLYSREDGWKLFDEMMALKIKAMGLGPDALMLIQQIDQKHIIEPISVINHPDFSIDEFKRRIEEQKSVQAIEKLIIAFKFFLDQNFITQTEFESVYEFLMNIRSDVERAPQAEIMEKLMAPALPRIGYLIDKIILAAGLKNGSPAKIEAIIQAMNPPTIMIFPPPPVDYAAINRNVMAALKAALPNASSEMIANLFIVLQVPVHAFGATPPEPPTGIGPYPGFADGFAAAQVGGIVRQLDSVYVFNGGQANYVLKTPTAPERSEMIIAYLVVKQGANVDLANLVAKWAELEGEFIVMQTSPTDNKPVFEVHAVMEQSNESPVSDPRQREMRFTGVLGKTVDGKFFIGNIAESTGRIVIDALSVTDREDFIGKFVIITGTVAEWAPGGAVPAKIKATAISLNNTSGFAVSN